MDFFNKLGKKASETYQITKEKAAIISEELKLKGKISDLNDKIEKLYLEIGKTVYNEVKDGRDVEREEISAKCDEITQMQDEISKLQSDILALKNVKKCVNCGEEVELNAAFCSKCGKEQPKRESVEIKEEPAEVKETEVIEVNDVENNNNNENLQNNEDKSIVNNVENNNENNNNENNNQ